MTENIVQNDDTESFDAAMRDMIATIQTGYLVEEEYAPRKPSDRDIEWLSAWIISEGWSRRPQS